MASVSDLEPVSTKPPLVDADPGISLGDLLMMLRRHLLFILACVALSTLAALLYVKRATSIYEATATLRIDPGRTTSLGLSDLGGGESSQDSLQTEIAIVQSDAVAIVTLHSLSNTEFAEYTGQSKKDFDLLPGSTKLTPAQEAILARLKGELKVKEVEGTQLVAVSMRDPDPAMAALVTNKVVDAYLQQSILSRVNSADEVSRRLSDQLDTLRKNAEDSQSRLADFEEKNHIIGTDSTAGAGASNTTTDRLRLLNSNLAQAQADRIVKEAQLRALQDHPAALTALFPSPQMTALQTEQGKLYAESAQLGAKFGPNYPPLAEINANLKKVQEQIDANMASAQSRLRQQYQAALATETLLQQQYSDQEGKAYAINREEAGYAALQAEVSASRELYNTLQRKLQQAGVNAGLAAVNTMLLDKARIPLLPLEPKKQTILGFGVFLGLFVGVGMAFLLEAAQDKIQNAEHLERSIGLPVLASIPHSKAQSAKSSGGAIEAPVILASPESLDAESFHFLRNVIAASAPGSKARTILFTQALPAEGSSTVSANYAVAVAQGGAKVLLVDANLRNPGLHRHFGVPVTTGGLSGILTGVLGSNPYLPPVSSLPNLTLLQAGEPASLPSVLLSSTGFEQLLQTWKADFDVIILDSAPLLSFSDSIPLCAMADITILVGRYNISPVKSLKRVRSVLARSNASVAGAIFNDAPVDSFEYGGYAVA